jgi:predicted O-linked N-acetylglucosamine transferase (SPINDLY family)
LNQFVKASGHALQVWVRILQALPGSRLLMLGQPGSHWDRACALFREGGIAADRVELVARGPRRAYLERYHDMDLALDPFPYNGHTTTLDALWMGVPVVSLAGRTGVGRAGVSVLSNVGLPELIAGTTDEYLAIALEWARDTTRLAAVRAGLRERMRASPVMDGPQYAVAVDAALRAMWQTWCGR